MAEKTNAGVAAFVADITSMCGLGSDGIAALLSADSLDRCCIHQFILPCCFGALLQFVQLRFQCTVTVWLIQVMHFDCHNLSSDMLYVGCCRNPSMSSPTASLVMMRHPASSALTRKRAKFL